MKPQIRIVEHQPRPPRPVEDREGKLGEFLKKGHKFAPEEFPFGIVLTAGTVWLESSTRWETEDGATEGAQRLVAALEEFFDELREEALKKLGVPEGFLEGDTKYSSMGTAHGILQELTNAKRAVESDRIQESIPKSGQVRQEETAIHVTPCTCPMMKGEQHYHITPEDVVPWDVFQVELQRYTDGRSHVSIDQEIQGTIPKLPFTTQVPWSGTLLRATSMGVQVDHVDAPLPAGEVFKVGEPQQFTQEGICHPPEGQPVKPGPTEGIDLSTIRVQGRPPDSIEAQEDGSVTVTGTVEDTQFETEVMGHPPEGSPVQRLREDLSHLSADQRGKVFEEIMEGYHSCGEEMDATGYCPRCHR